MILFLFIKNLALMACELQRVVVIYIPTSSKCNLKETKVLIFIAENVNKRHLNKLSLATV